jgi:hypothetical protein
MRCGRPGRMTRTSRSSCTRDALDFERTAGNVETTAREGAFNTAEATRCSCKGAPVIKLWQFWNVERRKVVNVVTVCVAVYVRSERLADVERR